MSSVALFCDDGAEPAAPVFLDNAGAYLSMNICVAQLFKQAKEKA